MYDAIESGPGSLKPTVTNDERSVTQPNAKQDR